MKSDGMIKKNIIYLRLVSQNNRNINMFYLQFAKSPRIYICNCFLDFETLLQAPNVAENTQESKCLYILQGRFQANCRYKIYLDVCSRAPVPKNNAVLQEFICNQLIKANWRQRYLFLNSRYFFIFFNLLLENTSDNFKITT